MTVIERIGVVISGANPYPRVVSARDLDPGEQPRTDLGEVVYVPEATTQMAVCLTDAERERVLWWLHKPVPPGPMKELDEAIIRKLNEGQ